jgi:ketosteroid isomerase-like protein
VSRDNVELVLTLLTAAFRGDLVKAIDDETKLREVETAFARWAEPDFEWVMVGPFYVRDQQQGFDGRGLEDFRVAWGDWMTPYESYEIEPEEAIDAGDSVVLLVRQVGKTRTGGVEMENQGAAVVWVRDGRMRRVEFHLDRDAAMRAAGLSE